jgi:hypothetical protein
MRRFAISRGSEKSDSGEDDQLLWYLRLLRDIDPLGLQLSKSEIESAVKAVVYIKPSDPLPEMLESSALCMDEPSLRTQLYGLEWQDIVEAAEECLSTSTGVSQVVLRDVTLFLRRRGLEYFKGFRVVPVPELEAAAGSFYTTGRVFTGFVNVAVPDLTRAAGLFYERE